MLPKITHPIFTLDLPISKKRISYRPMLVKEEKMLLLAKESNTEPEIIENFKAVLQNCVKEPLDFDEMPLVEVEFIFLNIRSKSVNNIIPVNVTDPHNPSIKHKVEIDLDEVTIKNNNTSGIVELQDGISLKLKVPTLATLKNISRSQYENIEAFNIQTLKECMDCIYDSENLYKIKDTPPNEVDAFIDSLTAKHLEGIKKFFDNIPKLNIEVNFTDSKGVPSTRTLDTFYDFFQ